MKKNKNVLLLVGIVCQAVVIVLLLVKLFVQLAKGEAENSRLLLVLGEMLPIVILLAALIFPMMLLSHNRKNKTGEILPILSIAINGGVFVWTVGSLFTVTYPQFLILSSLGMAEAYLSVIGEFLKNGGLLFVVANVLVILGSLFSLPAKKCKRKIKAAIFDVDGTLVNSLTFWEALWTGLGKTFAGDETFCPSQADDKEIRTLALKEAMQLIHDHYAMGDSADELLDYANNLVVKFYSEIVELKAGVKPFLDHCRNNGVKMCIASASATDMLEIVLNRCGIRDYFLHVFSCADLGVGKEEPDVFLQAAQFLGSEIADTWVFEDSLQAIETVTKLGMPTVGIYDPYNYGQDRIKELATEYIAPGETLERLI